MPGKFEIYEDSAGLYRFRLRDEGGDVVASGHGYPTKAEARRGCEMVRPSADGAEIVEVER